MEKIDNEKEKQHGEEKLQRRVQEEGTFFQEKKPENTAFSTASRQSFSALSLSFASYHVAITSTCKPKIFYQVPGVHIGLAV